MAYPIALPPEPPRYQAVRDMAVDMAHSTETEERVWAWLLTRQAEGRGVEDCRDQHTFYDFRVRRNPRSRWWNVDAKRDRWCVDTNRHSYETQNVYEDGFIEPGWSVNPKLDAAIVHIVGTDNAHILNLHVLRRFVQEVTFNYIYLPENWLHKHMANKPKPVDPANPKGTDGLRFSSEVWIVPVPDMQRAGAIIATITI